MSVDLHCHLLPGIDDGPDTMEDAIALARALVSAGTTTVAATPHVSHTYPNSAAEISVALDELRAALTAERIALEVVPGAEISALLAAELEPGEVTRLRLGHGPYLLLECPLTAVLGDFESTVHRLTVHGSRVVLAHPERSPAFLRNPDLLPRLVARGAIASITAASLSGAFGSNRRRFALDAVRAGFAHNVASDAHGAVRRPPGVRGAVDEAGLGWASDWLTNGVPAAVLRGDPLPPRPHQPPRGLLQRLRRTGRR